MIAAVAVSVLYLVPWVVGLVLSLRRWGAARWARVATVAFAVLTAAGALSIVWQVWSLGVDQTTVTMTGRYGALAWLGPVLTLLQFVGFVLVVAAVFSARGTFRGLRQSSEPSARVD